jgi:hypothetical protein
VSELRALDPTPETVKLVSGVEVEILPLRARQFFKFLRIITHGALPVVRDGALFQLDGDLSGTEFTGRLISLVVLSIPDAEDETIEFVQAMCQPAGLAPGRRLNKQDQERNAARWAELDLELANPELDDLITILEAVVKAEAEDIQALGKRLQAMFSLANRTGQLSPSTNPQTSPAPNSSADSPEPTTSSPASTADGPTTSSASSRSAGSARRSRRSENVSTTETLSSVNG